MVKEMLEIGREIPEASDERAAQLNEKAERISARLATNSRKLFR